MGSFAANGFGLHDMIGNVGMEDGCAGSYSGAPGGGTARESGSLCVLRGGSSLSRLYRDDVRVSSRNMESPEYRDRVVGFRCARTEPSFPSTHFKSETAERCPAAPGKPPR